MYSTVSRLRCWKWSQPLTWTSREIAPPKTHALTNDLRGRAPRYRYRSAPWDQRSTPTNMC
jgi:hypothetical protein